VECFLDQLGKSGIDAAVCDGVLYLCPICLQQRLVAARLEPVGAPTKAVVDALLWLLGGVSLTERLRSARASALAHKPSADVAIAVLLEYVAKLHAVAEASRLLEGCAYTNVHGGLVALMVAEHLRGSCPRIVPACAVLREFQQSTGYELGAKAVRCLQMQRAIDVARAASTSRARGKLIAELASNFDTDALESLLQRFLSIDACNALQLDLNELISEGDEGDNETEVDAKGGGGLDLSHRRDRLRRLAESLIGPLLRLRWIGNQEACPEAKKLHRRLSRFLEIPARAAAFRSGLFREGSMRPLDADLAQRAPLLREHARQLAATHTIMVIEDNAPLVEISAAGAGETVNANMSHWTATGWIPCDPAGATLGDGHTLSTAVGVYIATAGPLLGVAFPSVRAGARSSSHPGLCLDARFARAGDATCRWGMSDGTLARLLHPRDGLCSALMNGEGLSMRTHVPVKAQIGHLIKMKVLQLDSNATHVYGNLNHTSAAVLPLHVWSFLERAEGTDVGAYVEGAREGVRAHAHRYYGAMWTEDGSSMRMASLRIGAPQPVNSLAADDQWALALFLSQGTGQLSRGRYTDCGELGDSQRPLLQVDLGTTSVLDGCVLREMKAVAQGAFRSEAEAHAHVRALRMVHALNDPVRPQMHNQFSLLKSLLVRRWKNGSVDPERTMQGFTKFQPSKEGQGFRNKKELMARRAQSYLNVQQLRFRIFEAAAYGDRVAHAADGSLDREDYYSRFMAMVHASSGPDANGLVDEEMSDMNHEIFDVAVPFLMEIDMTRGGITEVPPMMCAYWLAWAQETNCPRIFRHMVEQLGRPLLRSAQRNAYVLHNTAPSQTGRPNSGQEVDCLQELIVLIVQRYKLKTSGKGEEAKQLIERMNVLASNLDLPLEVIPYLETEWAGMMRKTYESRAMRRSAAIDVMTWHYLRSFGVRDPYRRIASGADGEVARWELSTKLLLNEASEAVLSASCFFYIDPEGGPLRLLAPSGLLDAAAVPNSNSVDKPPPLVEFETGRKPLFGAELVGLCFGFDGRWRSRNGVGVGELRVPHGVPSEKRPPAQPGLAPSSLSALELRPLTSDEPMSNKEYLQIIWNTGALRPASRSLSDTSQLQHVLPPRALLLSLDGEDATSVASDQLKHKLLETLRMGKPFIVAPAISLQQASAQAFDASYKIFISGVVASRTPSGNRRYSPEVWSQTTAAERVCTQDKPAKPAAATGKSQRLRLYLYSKDAKLDAPSGGERRVRASSRSGIEQTVDHLVEAAKATDPALAVKEATEAGEIELLLKHTRGVHLLSSQQSSGRLPKAPGAKNTTDKGLRQLRNARTATQSRGRAQMIQS
jgi:hypothetical protein